MSAGTSPIPHFLKLQNGVNELTSVGLMFTFTFTGEKCGMRVVILVVKGQHICIEIE